MSEGVTQTCWVTGAHGFIGRQVALKLGQQGHRVVGIGHGAWPPSEWKKWGLVHWLNGEVSTSNFNLLKERYGLPSKIFHLAGGSSVGDANLYPLEDFKRNVVATAELFEWVRQESPGTKVVSSSSAAVYGNMYPDPIKESESPAPYSAYGYSKKMMEEVCSLYAFNYGIKVVVARIFSVYGVGLRRQLLWDICEKMQDQPTRLELSGEGSEVRDWVHVDDVALALVAIIEAASVEAPLINIGSGIGTPVREIAKFLAHQWGEEDKNNCVRELVFDSKRRIGDPHTLIADTTALELVGVTMKKNLFQGLKEYVKWYKSQININQNQDPI